jgi:hypothetical protein
VLRDLIDTLEREFGLVQTSEKFERFRQFVHSRVPLVGDRIELRHELLRKERIICGEHGRGVPTHQNLCPACGGIGLLVPA